MLRVSEGRSTPAGRRHASDSILTSAAQPRRSPQSSVAAALIVMAACLVVARGRALAATFMLNLGYTQVVRALPELEGYSPPACGQGSAERVVFPGLLAALGLSHQWSPQDGRVWLALGRAAWLGGDCQAAFADWGEAAARSGDAAQWARIEIARGWYFLGERDRAVKLFKEAGAARYLFGWASYAAKSGQPALADDLYQLAFEVEPLYEIAQLWAFGYVAANQPDEAAGVWRRVADLSTPDLAVHWIAVGETAEHDEDWGAARDAFERAISISGGSYPAYLRLGRALVHLQDWPNATEAYRQALAIQPTASSEAYIALGNIEVEQGHYPAAMDWYDRAIQVLPRGDPWPNIAAGDAAVRFGDLPEAERRYQAALVESPGHFGALVALGQLYHREGRLAEAIDALEQANAPSPNCNVLSLLADSYRQIGDMERSSDRAALFDQICAP